MKKKHLKRWEKKRAKGKSKFILLDGGVFFGLIMFGIVVPAINIVVNFIGNGFSFSFFTETFKENFQFFLIFNSLMSFPIGCFFGWLNWELTERKYNEMIQKR